ncbi:MAG: hypothetical protein HZB26_06955 [Candidatus Hydrogenedentes bacterium]|nr:hypothetical protein [Candidatus Hydrogenedentota bacterium]
MTTRDTVGAAILVCLFAILIAVLAYTTRRPPGESIDPKDSPIVQQRIRNLQTTTEK